MSDPRGRHFVKEQPVPSDSAHHGGSFRKYMEDKNRKLHEQFEQQADLAAQSSSSSKLFAGVRIHVNGLTTPTHQELKLLMAQHGGSFENYYYRDQVTHIICSNLTDQKIKHFHKERMPTPIIRPEWIVDSLKADKLLPLREYQLWRLRHVQQMATPAAASQQVVQASEGTVALHAEMKQAHNAQAAGSTAAASAAAASRAANQAAQEVATRARAACDVLRGPPMTTHNNPEFMDTYFRSSRLHFIGTWKARIEALAARMCPEAPSPSLAHPSHLRIGQATASGPASGRCIIHLDMDCFFASVAELTDPALKGQPLAVSHSNSAQGTGEISSANYLAREFGICAGMCIAEGKRRCPNLVVMPYLFERFEEISEQVYRILMQNTSAVQPVSVDEAYLDVTGLGDPVGIAEAIRSAIQQETGCTASAGIAANMLLARLATKRAKPDGVFQLLPSQVDAHLLALPVAELPGVGWALQRRLTELEIATAADVRKKTRGALQRELGDKTGQALWDAAYGLDGRLVEAPKPRKSIGAEVNWGVRFATENDAEVFLDGIAGEVCKRLDAAGVRGRALTLKLKRRKAGAPEPPKFMGHGSCDNLSRSMTLTHFTANPGEVAAAARTLLRALRVPCQEIRGIGIAIAKLDTETCSSSRSSHQQQIATATGPSRIPYTPIVALPPASQLDAEVLDALPLPLRRELERAYGLDAQRSPPAKVRRGAGRSRAAERPAKRMRTPPLNTRAPAEARRPAPTPIDPNVLAQLPEAMQRELLATLPSNRLPPSHPSHPLTTSRDDTTVRPDDRAAASGASAWAPAPGLQETRDMCAALHAALEAIASTAQPRTWRKHQGRRSTGPDDGGVATAVQSSVEVEDLGMLKVEALCELCVQWGQGLLVDNLESLHFLLRRLHQYQRTWTQFQAHIKAGIDQLQKLVQAQYGCPVLLL
ncbi:hypothetical protein WJX73_010812 [Symbiochloris irregularis]|uniref:DNA repair protein REV1 n=1 Tax=Symbiochloris irregularis TaxID=706552 RepID=A0AAW1PC76_9CHLO